MEPGRRCPGSPSPPPLTTLSGQRNPDRDAPLCLRHLPPRDAGGEGIWNGEEMGEDRREIPWIPSPPALSGGRCHGVTEGGLPTPTARKEGGAEAPPSCLGRLVFRRPLVVADGDCAGTSR